MNKQMVQHKITIMSLQKNPLQSRDPNVEYIISDILRILDSLLQENGIVIIGHGYSMLHTFEKSPLHIGFLFACVIL
jgi:hypothetical protein